MTYTQGGIGTVPAFFLLVGIATIAMAILRPDKPHTLRITDKHLKELYGNPPYRFAVYDSSNLSQVRTVKADGECWTISFCTSMRRKSTNSGAVNPNDSR